jgi:hypothetical protein
MREGRHSHSLQLEELWVGKAGKALESSDNFGWKSIERDGQLGANYDLDRKTVWKQTPNID